MYQDGTSFKSNYLGIPVIKNWGFKNVQEFSFLGTSKTSHAQERLFSHPEKEPLELNSHSLSASMSFRLALLSVDFVCHSSGLSLSLFLDSH